MTTDGATAANGMAGTGTAGGGGGSAGAIGGTGGDGGGNPGSGQPTGVAGVNVTAGTMGAGGGGGGSNGFGVAGGSQFTFFPSISGSNGGNGGSVTGTGSGGGGGGGEGGYGIVGNIGGGGSVVVVSPSDSALGGNGGNGGTSVPAPAGNGGDGGVGVFFGPAFGGNALNQSGGSVTGGNGGSGSMNGAGGAGVVGANLTVLLGGGTITGGIAGDGVTQANAITFASGANTLTLGGGSLSGNVAINAGTLTFNQTTAQTLPNVITGTGAVINSGTGTLTLSGANTYSGGTTLSAGILRVGVGTVGTPGAITSSAIGAGPLTLNGGTLQLGGGFIIANTVALGAAGGTIDAAAHSFAISGNIIDGSGVPGSLTFTSTGGPGPVTLSGNNSYSGPTIITSSVGLSPASNASLSPNSDFTVDGDLGLSGTTSTIRSLSGNGTVSDVGAPPATLTVALPSGTFMFSGIISSGPFPFGGGAVSLIKSGGGTQILSGANTYSGGTTLSAGILRVGVDTVGTPGAITSSAIGTGTLTFNGGTLQMGGNFTIANAVKINSTGGIIDAGGHSATFSGNITDGSGSPAGGLTITSSGGFGGATLSGVNTYSGPTHVTATVNLSVGSSTGLSPNSDFTIDAPSTLALNGNSSTIRSLSGTGSVINFTPNPVTLTIASPSGTTTFSGVICECGPRALSLVKDGAGRQILTGANIYTGGTFLNGGTLGIGNGQALGTGPLAMAAGTTLDLIGTLTVANAIGIAGDPAFEVDGTDVATLSGIIADRATPGTLAKTGTGTLVLSGNSTYTGPTLVQNGTLAVTGSIVSVATVESNAVLGGSGTVGGIIAQSGGTVAPGVLTPFSTLNVAGNASFASGSTFLVNVNAGGQNDRLAVTGKATLSGGTVQVLAANGSYTQANRYTILTANGGVAGTFANLTVNQNFAFLTPTLVYDPSDVVLAFLLTTVTPTMPAGAPAGPPAPIPFPSVALTRNQAATGAAIQALGLGNAVYNAVVGQTVAGARQAFDALSGEIHASAVTAAFEDQRLPREAILDRLSQPAETPVLGAATTMTGAYAADLPSRKGPALAPVAVQMYQPRLFGLWGQGFGDWGKTDGDHNAAKLSRDTGGFIIGADAERQLFNGDWRFGIAGGYTDDSLKVSARNSSGDYQSIFGALYGKASYGAIDLKAGAILASTNTHTSRSIIFPGFADAAGSSYGGYAAQGFGELGYRLPFHGTLWSYVPWLSSLTATYEPFLQGAVMHIDQNRYVETALNAGLVGAARGYDLGTTTLGLRTQYQLASLPGFTWTSLLGWRHAFGDVRPSVVQSFAGSFNSFSVAGVPIDRDAFVSETSLDYAVSRRVTVGLSYSGQYGKRATDSAFKGHVDVSFW